MIKNYFKIAFRNLVKFKSYALINIFGLAIGLACCMIIIQHLRDEFKYDQHHDNIEQLYRVGSTFKTVDENAITAASPSPLAWELAENYPEIKATTRILKISNAAQHLVTYDSEAFFEKDGLLVDSTFFRIFNYEFLKGDPHSVLNTPYTVVISKEMASKLFKDQDPINETIKIGDQWSEDEYKITGVIDNKKFASHIPGNFFMNMNSGAIGTHFYKTNEWASNNLFHTYVLLHPEASAKSLAAKFPALIEQKIGKKLREYGIEKNFYLEKVASIHLESKAIRQLTPSVDMTFIYIFAAIAIFILLIACINFMNLSTAKATNRAQEIGVRKVIGASRSMLSRQFLVEAFVYTFIAFLLAILIGEMAMPFFNHLSGKELNLYFWEDHQLMIWMLGILLFTAIIAGSYPAIYLSSFSPAKIFRGNIGGRYSAKQIRKGLVVVQFIVSIALIQSVLVIQKQMNYIQQKKLGFNTEAKLVIPLNTSAAAKNHKVLKESFSTIKNVQQVAATSTSPGSPNVSDMTVYGEEQTLDVSNYVLRSTVDPEYMPLMEFELLAGRHFNSDRLMDTVRSVIINEKLMKGLGYNLENAINKNVYRTWNDELTTFKIIGVVKNFHYSTLHREVMNHIFLWMPREQPSQLVASVSTDDLPKLISSFQKEWTNINPNQPFDYFFIDDKLQEAYVSDQRMAKSIYAFTLLAIFLSCLGLFGLAAFAAESRSKEISIRKVLGATVSNIVGLLSKDFLVLVLVALLIATPFAYYFMTNWLEDFHYHINMPWWTFALAGIVALIIAFLTISFQGVKAAMANPIDTLKND